MGILKDKLLKGEFVITAELCPPKGADIAPFVKKAHLLKGHVDAVNVTDNQRAIMRLSSLAAAHILYREGVEPIYQLICRDKNRIALQSDLLGAAALGIENVLALTGDMITSGDNKMAKPVFDIESVQLLRIASLLNEGKDANGVALKGATHFFLGSSVNPGSTPIEPVVIKFQQKIEAGAQYFQTQAIFDAARLNGFMKCVEGSNAKVLAGILLLKSAKMARFLNDNVPGVKVPDPLIEELEKSTDPIKTGIEIAARQVNEFRGICAGVHIMCIGSEERTIDIIARAKELAGSR